MNIFADDIRAAAPYLEVRRTEDSFDVMVPLMQSKNLMADPLWRALRIKGPPDEESQLQNFFEFSCPDRTQGAVLILDNFTMTAYRTSEDTCWLVLSLGDYPPRPRRDLIYTALWEAGIRVLEYRFLNSSPQKVLFEREHRKRPGAFNDRAAAEEGYTRYTRHMQGPGEP